VNFDECITVYRLLEFRVAQPVARVGSRSDSLSRNLRHSQSRAPTQLNSTSFNGRRC